MKQRQPMAEIPLFVRLLPLKLVSVLFIICNKILLSQENFSPSLTSDDDRKLKAPRTAFKCFSDAKQSEIMEQNPSCELNTILTITAQQWNQLSAKERSFWNEESRNDKVRYVGIHCVPEDYKSILTSSLPHLSYVREKAECRGVVRTPKRRAKKDPLAPRRPMSAFLKFSKTRRSMVKTANPDLE